jgi:hypothetical protein
MKLYKTIFQESWEITRRHPLLWFFGVCVFFWGGKGIELEQFFTNADLLRSPLSPFRPTFWSGRQWMVVVDIFNGDMWWIAGFVAILVVLVLLVFALIMSAHIALIDAYGQFDANKNGRYKMHHAWMAITKDFWSVSFVQLLTKGLAYVLLAVAAVPLFLNQLGDWQIVYSLGLFLLVTPIAVYLSAVAKFAMNDIVVNNTPWMTALSRGRALLHAQFSLVLEFLVFVYIVYSLVTAAAIVITNIVTLPMLLAVTSNAGLDYVVSGYPLYEIMYSSIGALTLLVGVALFSSWHMGSWTLLYRELSKGGQKSVMKQWWNRGA